MLIKAPSKLNFFLHITGKRDDGYHFLQSLISFVDLCDELEIQPSNRISLKIEGEFARSSGAVADNLVFKAARALHKYAGLSSSTGAEITLQKNIPVGAGLGGGSADAAAVLNGLNDFWKIGLSKDKLQKIGAELGADIPVCFEKSPMFVEGVGEELTDAPALPQMNILLVFPFEHVSTPEVFQAGDFDFESGINMPSYFADVEDFAKWLDAKTTNDLFQPALSICPEIAKTIELIKAEDGCLISRMTGSGSCCFGIFDNAQSMLEAAESIKIADPSLFMQTTKTLI